MTNCHSMTDDLYYCPKCNKLVQTYIKSVDEVYPVLRTNITSRSNVRFCISCGSDIFDEELDNDNLMRAYDLFRTKFNIITPEEIKTIREKHGLTQKTFSELCGFNPIAIKRLEEGVIANRVQNNILTLLKDDDNFNKIVFLNKDLL